MTSDRDPAGGSEDVEPYDHAGTDAPAERREGHPDEFLEEGAPSTGAASVPAHAAEEPTPAEKHKRAANMLPGRERRTLGLERLLVRLIATAGVVGIGVAIGAIMASSKSQGWVIGLVISIVTVVLSAILWSSRQV